MRTLSASRPGPSEGWLSGPSSPRLTAVFDSRGLLFAETVALLALVAIVATKVWQDHLSVGFGLLALTALIWLPELWRARMRRWWFVYVWGIFFYTLLRALADETGIPIQTSYVIRFDHFLFLGREPVEVLQDRFFRTDHVSALDIGAVATHWSFFLAPHLAGVVIFVWRRDLFPRYAAAVVGTMYAGLLLFFLAPTTPPWLAGKAGELSDVFRVMDFVGGRVDSSTYASFNAALGEPNSVAAMPSIHMAVTFVMYLWARAHCRRAALPLLIYCGVMAFALVYLAEHYVPDLLAGIACAMVCHLIVRRAVPATSPRPV